MKKKIELTNAEQEQKEKDLELVEGTFFYHSKPNCSITFPFQSIWEEEPKEYTLIDKKSSRLPRCVKEYINNYGAIEIAHKYLLDTNGNAIGVASSTREQVYSFV